MRLLDPSGLVPEFRGFGVHGFWECWGFQGSYENASLLRTKMGYKLYD